jgi:glycosyltransferase involved in cell wall biosynthesis
VRVLVVAPYPPRRDGIASYAAVQVQRLREAGHTVTVLSPPDGDGDVRAEFLGGGAFRRAAALAPGHDRVVVHFQPSLYYLPRAPRSKIATSRALLSLCRRPNVEILVHEADPPKLWRPDYALLAAAFRRAPRLWFHTLAEQAALERGYRVRTRGALVRHRDGIRVHAIGRDEARRRLGVDPEEPLLVCPGFVHPDKGFDRAVEALARAGEGTLVVVGSVREASPANVTYASRLRGACAATPGASWREGFVSDGDLDAWIAAADAVVLPYRRSWSSGMLARAQALGTPAIVARVGGLPEQAEDADVVFDTDQELETAMRDAVARAAGRLREAR